jgi:hypothetical protein
MLLKKPNITKMLGVDLLHISPDDSKALSVDASKTQAKSVGAPQVIVYEYDCGFFVYVNVDEPIEEEELRKTYSGALVRLLTLAQAHKCWFLHIEADGVLYADELEMFDW